MATGTTAEAARAASWCLGVAPLQKEAALSCWHRGFGAALCRFAVGVIRGALEHWSQSENEKCTRQFNYLNEGGQQLWTGRKQFM